MEGGRERGRGERKKEDPGNKKLLNSTTNSTQMKHVMEELKDKVENIT